MAGEDLASYGSAAASGAAAGSTFGPWGMAAGGALGLGLQLFGSYGRQQAASAQERAQEGMIQTQLKEDALRQEQMHVQGQRDLLTEARNIQNAKAVSLTRATSQGAGTGSNSSGLAGGQAQIGNRGALNQLNIRQNVEAGDRMFALKQQLAEQQIAYAQAGGQMNTAQGFQSLGSGVLQSLPYARSLFSGGQPQSPGPYQPPVNDT